MTIWDTAALNSAGLNLQAVFNLDELPAEIVAELRCRFDPGHRYRQLILLGHGGKALWASVMASGIVSENPIDDFSVRTVASWFAQQFGDNCRAIIYPGSDAVRLQALGKIAGWHHASPMMIGIDKEWGTWFAYRAVVLADTELQPTRSVDSESPCLTCRHKICIASCPASALDGGAFDLGQCVAYRKRSDSSCKATCLARVSCPVGSAHRYCAEQIRHAYSISMTSIERHT